MPPYRLTSINLVNVICKSWFNGFDFIHNNLDSLLLMENGALMHIGAAASSLHEMAYKST